MGDTTSIDDLPTDPIMGGNQNNLTIQKMEINGGMGSMGSMGSMGGMGGVPQNVQIPPQLQGQVYSPNIAGMNMGGGGGGGGGMMSGPNQQPNIINELVNGIQRASANGLTNLPSRDIPMSTSNMMNDQQINPNFIPRQPQNQPQNNNYIEEHEEDVMNDIKYATQVRTDDNMENIYKLIQVPLLVGILYFAFQLPITRKYILKFVPSVFNVDGNFNISGLVFMSALFALGYFGLTKLLDCVETL